MVMPERARVTIARKTPENMPVSEAGPPGRSSCNNTVDLFGIDMQTQVNKTRIPSNEVSSHIGEVITVTGWLHSWREMGGVSFLVLRDAWGTIQAVAETDEELRPLRTQEAGVESVISVSGCVLAMPQAPGGVELHELRIEVISPVSETPVVPINKPRLNAQIGTLLDHAVVTNRHPTRRAILRLGAGAMLTFRSALHE